MIKDKTTQSEAEHERSVTYFSYKFIDKSSVTLCRIWIYDYKEHNYEQIQEKKPNHGKKTDNTSQCAAVGSLQESNQRDADIPHKPDLL